MNLEAAIEKVLAELEETRDRLPHLADTAAHAAADFAVAEAKARTNYRAMQVEKAKKFTVSEVDDFAVLQTKDERLAHELASEMLRVARDSIRVLVARLDGYRSLMASQRVGI